MSSQTTQTTSLTTPGAWKALLDPAVDSNVPEAAAVFARFLASSGLYIDAVRRGTPGDALSDSEVRACVQALRGAHSARKESNVEEVEDDDEVESGEGGGESGDVEVDESETSDSASTSTSSSSSDGFSDEIGNAEDTPILPPPPPVPTSDTVDAKIDALYAHLHSHRATLFQRQHRDGEKKITFSLAGSFKVGVGSVQVGNKQYIGSNPAFIQHPFVNTAVYLTPVEQQEGLSDAEREAYRLAMAILLEIDPDYTEGATLVNFSLLNSPTHYVKQHVDKNDVSYQYALSLGSFEGVRLRVTGEDSQAQDFGIRRKVLRFDGRLPHEAVLAPTFNGNRFTVIWYKNFDARQTKAAPILQTPTIVYECATESPPVNGKRHPSPTSSTQTEEDGSQRKRARVDDQSSSEEEEEHAISTAAPAPEQARQERAPHLLLFGDEAERLERSRAIAQCKLQKINVPIEKKQPLPEGWAIGKCPAGRGQPGQDFTLRCILARSHALALGGRASDVVVYKRDRVTRVLLSPLGVQVFRQTAETMTSEKLQTLRTDSESAVDGGAILELLATMREAGLERSMDTGMPLPDLSIHTEELNKAWIEMTVAGVEAMGSTASNDTLTAWKTACDTFEALMRAENDAHEASVAASTEE